MSVISQHKLLKASLVIGASCFGLGGLPQSARAIVFNINNTTITNGSTSPVNVLSTDGSTYIQLTDYNSPGFIPGGFPAGGYNVSAAGLGLYKTPVTFTGSTFTIQFFDNAGTPETPSLGDPVALVLSAYTVGFAENYSTLTPPAFPTLDFVASDSSFTLTGNNFSSAGLKTFNAPPTLAAGATATITAQNFPIVSSDIKTPNRISSITAEPVPFESDVLPLLGATLLFGGGVWWKRRRAASQIDLTAALDHGDRPSSES